MKIKFLLILVLCCLTQSARAGGISGQGNLVGVGVFVTGDCLKSFGGLFVKDAGAPCGSGSGTVTSVNASGGTTGLSFAGGPITTSGVLTMSGILNIANGGNGTASPGIVASTGITIGSTWPVQTVALSNQITAGGPIGSSTIVPVITYNAQGQLTAVGTASISSNPGTVTSVSVVTANGVSGSVANPTTTPAITLTLGAITPSSVNGVTITNANAPTWTIGSSSGVPVVTASSPLVITGATGDITCPTCNTTSSNVTSVSNSDGTLTISPTTGAVVASLALGHANSWTGQQTFGTSAPIFSTMTSGSVLFAGTSGLLSQDNANFFWDAGNIRLGIGVATPTNILSFSGQAARTIWTERQTTSNTAGNNLILAVGGATSGATNKAGGDLILSSGTATGTGVSNFIVQVPPINTTGTADNVSTAVMTIASGGKLTYQGINAASTSTSIGAAGQFISFQPGNGQSTTFSTTTNIGGTAGTLFLTGGNGGNATGGTNNLAGAGGPITPRSGSGGSITTTGAGTNTAGAGGAFGLTSSAGGVVQGNSGTTNTGGNGGSLPIISGAGGNVTTTGSTTNVGGAGGSVAVTIGAGGNASGATTNNGGVGGSVSYVAGNGGTSATAGTAGNGGTVTFAAGAAGVGSGGASSGTNGTITFRIGATVKQFINASGFTSIGSGTTALSTLDVFGGTAIGSYAGANAAPSNGLIVSGSVGIGTSSPIYKTDMVGGDVGVGTTGGRLRFKEAANGSMGTGTLIGGTLLINNTSITANSRIFLTDIGGGVIANIGALYVSATSVGASFTVSSSNVLDTSTFNWVIFEPY